MLVFRKRAWAIWKSTGGFGLFRSERPLMTGGRDRDGV
jgi:hypothetical protein